MSWKRYAGLRTKMVCRECGEFSSEQLCWACSCVFVKTGELRAELARQRPVVEAARAVLWLDGKGRSTKEALDKLALELMALDRQEKDDC